MNTFSNYQKKNENHAKKGTDYPKARHTFGLWNSRQWRTSLKWDFMNQFSQNIFSSR